MRIFSCLVGQHNLWLVGVAAIVCALGSWTSMQLYGRVRRHAEMSSTWTFLSAITVGATVWCTHFVAMLAYEPGIPIAYDPGLTAFSLLVAIAMAAIGLSVGALGFRHSTIVGGSILGIGIAVMHYTGMAAVTISAFVEWDWLYVAFSVAASMLLSSLALDLSVSDRDARRQIRSVGAFMAAIVLLHFTGMGAMKITLLAPVEGQLEFDVTKHFLAFAVAGVGLLVVGTGLASYALDHQSQGRAATRQRHILETSVDSMVIVRDGLITDTNSAFEKSVGLSREELLGRHVSDWLVELPELEGAALLSTSLRSADGAAIPVEVAVHREDVQGAGVEITYYSIRDLRPRLAQEQKIISLARNDSLTGLANRHWFREQLKALLARGDDRANVALLFLDLDRFKQVNDSLGHQVGDALLRIVAQRIKKTVRAEDVVARLGGDEFAVLVSGVEQVRKAADIAARLIDELSQPFDLEGHRANIGVSIGVAQSGQHGRETDELLKRADIAMYHAKSSGRGQVSLFEPEMDERLRERLAMETDLRNALVQDQFELFYQPQVDARSDTIVCLEALLRWRHPERGLVSPMDFIPIAEEIGLMKGIGSWVLRRACEDARNWPEHVSVAVNVSACQFGDDTVETDVRSALAQSGISPERLEIEITESLLLNDSENVISILRRLRALGIKIAMDDFGTGYSSLGYLSRFPMDKIKIDRSFVKSSSDQSSQAVIRAVIGLSASLGMSSTAEGVETLDQLTMLQAEGCTHLQGYFFSRPVEAQKVQELFQATSERRQRVA